MNLNFKQITPTGSDETALFDITMDGDYTLGELIDHILANKRDWGEIKWYSPLGYSKIEYHHGEITLGFRDPIAEKKRVLKIGGFGGWTRLDYNIEIE